jgi:hypothetical protein
LEIENINFIIKKTIVKEKKNYLMQIDSLFKINEKLNFSKDLKFWYLFNEKEKYSFGPFSSNEIVIMFLTKKIDDDILIRPVEIFKNKFSDNDFVHLKNFEDENYFFNNYEKYVNITSLENNYDKYLKDEKIRKIKEEEEKKQKEKENLLKKEKEKNKNKIELEKKIEEKDIKEIKEIKNDEEQKKLEEKKIEDKDLLNDNTNKKEEKNNVDVKNSSNNNEHIIVKNKKRKKGKPINLDIKTGFYTITNQEKNFSQIYVSGSSEPLNNIPNKP